MDYKLKLTIDAKEFEKEIKKAFKNVLGKGVMSGGHVGGGTTGGTSQTKRIDNIFSKFGTDFDNLSKSINKLTEDMNNSFAGFVKLNNINEEAARIIKSVNKARQEEIRVTNEQKSKLTRFNQMIDADAKLKRSNISTQNALIREGGVTGGGMSNILSLIGGRAGGAVGTGIDILDTKFKFYSRQQYDMSSKDKTKIYDKYEDTEEANKEIKRIEEEKSTNKNRAQLVKIAGITAGLIGVAGLGKMIIDSSPVLQSMLKLLNVGIMLILRPIGDFIGFMLRPLLIEFVKKVAIPAYKDGSKFAKQWGSKVGAGLLDFIHNPIAAMGAMIVGALTTWWAGPISVGTGLLGDDPEATKSSILNTVYGESPEAFNIGDTNAKDQVGGMFGQLQLDVTAWLMKPLGVASLKWSEFFEVTFPNAIEEMSKKLKFAFTSLKSLFQSIIDGVDNLKIKSTISLSTLKSLFLTIPEQIGLFVDELKKIPAKMALSLKTVFISIGKSLALLPSKILPWIEDALLEEYGIKKPGSTTPSGVGNTTTRTGKPPSIFKGPSGGYVDSSGNVIDINSPKGSNNTGFKWPSLKEILGKFMKDWKGNIKGGIKGGIKGPGVHAVAELLIWNVIEPWIGGMSPEYKKSMDERNARDKKSWDEMMKWFNDAFNQTDMPEFKNSIEETGEKLCSLSNNICSSNQKIDMLGDSSNIAGYKNYILSASADNPIAKFGLLATTQDQFGNELCSSKIQVIEFTNALKEATNQQQESNEGSSNECINNYGSIYGDLDGKPYIPPTFGPYNTPDPLNEPRSPYGPYCNPDFGKPYVPQKPKVKISDKAQAILDEYESYINGTCTEGRNDPQSSGPVVEHCYANCYFESGGVGLKEARDAANETAETWRDIYSNVTIQERASIDAATSMKILGRNFNSAESSSNSIASNMSGMSTVMAETHDKLMASLQRMSGMRRSSGSYTQQAKEAQKTMESMSNAFKTEQDPEYKVTWLNGNSRILRLSYAARAYYGNLATDDRLTGRKASIRSIVALAKGGIINEPIFGVGQNTGKGYIMGEKGPETITPGIGTSTGGGPNITINITANNIGDIERQLKPVLLRIIKESTSRAGIV
jgi:hypothetical protein